MHIPNTSKRYTYHSGIILGWRKLSHGALRPLQVLVVYLLSYQLAWGLPIGEQLAAGQASITRQDARNMTIEQLSEQAIINWQSFNIGANERVNVLQPHQMSALLSRVTGADPSKLMGQLQSNGHIFLVNPNGIVVGKDARIDVGALTASTLDIADEDFLDGGDFLFQGETDAGLVNLGKITADSGDVVLIAYVVDNEGEVRAEKGTAVLAAGREVLLTPNDDRRVTVVANVSESDAETAASGVENSGLLSAVRAELNAAGGNIYQLAIKQAGIVQATGVDVQNGRILLTVGGGDIAVDGSMHAQNANGDGGEIYIGGGTRGQDQRFENARTVTVSESSIVDVSALENSSGNGGNAVVWSDEGTAFAGDMRARAGNLGGDGGQLEISSPTNLDYTGSIDTRAPSGAIGNTLFDPDAATISTAAHDTANGVWNNATVSTMLESSGVAIDTSDAVGDISVEAPVSWAASSTLTLQSGESININSDIAGSNGTLSLLAGKLIDPSSTASGIAPTADINSDENAAIAVASLAIGQNPNASPGNANPNPFGDAMGSINLRGVVSANAVTIDVPSQGILASSALPAISIGNVANTIDTLTVNNPGGDLIRGIVAIADSAGGLDITNGFSSVEGDINIATVGNLTLSDGVIATQRGIASSANIHLAASGGAFINNSSAGAGALSQSNANDRFLIYSNNPTDTVKGGLVGDPVYNKTAAGNPPSSISQSGDRFVYEIAPTILFSATNQSREYGEANPAPVFSVSGLINGDLAADAYSGAPSITHTAVANTSVGDVLIDIALGSVVASDYDYQLGFDDGLLSILAAPLSINVADASRTYGAADPSFDATFSGFKLGEDRNTGLDSLNFSTSALSNSGVGTYNITANATAGNYDITVNNGTLTIDPALLTITANDDSRAYGDANPTFSASFSGFVLGQTASDVSGLSFSTTADLLSNVGSYAISPNSASIANYSISYVDGTLMVNPAPLNIAVTDASRLYGDANPVFSAAISGFKNGQDDSVLPNLIFNTPALINSNVGDFDIVASGASNANYSYSYSNGTLSIIPAPLTLIANDKGMVFGDPLPAFDVSFIGLRAGDDESVVGSISLSNSGGDNPDVGVHDIVISPSGISAVNYLLNLIDGELTVANQVLNIVADDFTRLYGEDNPDFTATITGFVGSDTEASTVSDLQFTTAAVIASNVGNYLITPSATVDPNYTPVFTDGTLTINPAFLSITANNQARLYGGANPVFTALFDGLVAGDTAADIGGLNLSTTANLNSGVGNYVIEASGASNANYTISHVDGRLTINQAPLTVNINDKSREYGDANPVFDAVFNGLVAGDTAADILGLSFQSTATQNSITGDYAITGSGSLSNYLPSFNSGTLTINPAALTLRTNSATRVYGGAEPLLTASGTGFKLGETVADIDQLVIANPVLNDSDVGDYSIRFDNAADQNYTITEEFGTLSITPAALNLQADDAHRIYGDANPELTATATGLAAGDTLADIVGLALSTTATSASSVGDYLIELSVGANPNYNVTTANGILSVDPRGLVLRSLDASSIFGDAIVAPVLEYDGLAAVDTPTSIGAVEIATPATNSFVGDYALTVTGGANPNYTITRQAGNYSITPRAASATANDASRDYGDTNPVFGFTFDNIITGGFAPDMSGVSLQTTATQASNVGDYAITFNGASTDVNYNLTYVPGTLTIDPVLLTLSANNANREYGLANPAFGFTLDGLKLSDTQANTLSDITLTTDASIGSNVGDYDIETAATLISDNYVLQTNSARLRITKAPISLLSVNFSQRLYGEDNPEFTLSAIGLRNGDTVNQAVTAGLVADVNALTPVGDYTVDILTTISPNYNVQATQSGVLRINPRTLNITTEDRNREYGEAPLALTFNVTGDGFASFDDADTLGLAVTSPGNQLTASVGDYAFQLAFNPTANYLFNFAGANYTVDTAALNVSWLNQNLEYGSLSGATPMPASIDGLKLGDTAASIGLQTQLNTAVLPLLGLGFYDFGAQLSSTNYTISSSVGGLTITPKNITLRLLDDIRRYYGNVGFNFSVEGLDFAAINPSSGAPTPLQNVLVGDDQLVDIIQLQTLNADRLNVGPHGLTFSYLVDTPNYNISFEPSSLSGALRVIPRPITVNLDPDAGAATAFYGDVNPNFKPLLTAAINLPSDLDDSLSSTITLDGPAIVNGDSLVNIIDTNTLPVAANGFIARGIYPLTGISVSDNYELSNANFGNVEITARPLTLNVNQVFTNIYGDGGVVQDLSADNFVDRPVGDEIIEEVFSLIAIDDSGLFAGIDADIGTYNMGFQSNDLNYVVAADSVNTAMLTINPKPVTVRLLDSVTRNYGSVEYSIDIEGLSFVGVDPESEEDTALGNLLVGDDQLKDIIELNRVTSGRQDVGLHNLTFSLLSTGSNYDAVVDADSLVDKLRIIPRPITVNLNGVSRQLDTVYGEEPDLNLVDYLTVVNTPILVISDDGGPSTFTTLSGPALAHGDGLQDVVGVDAIPVGANGLIQAGSYNVNGFVTSDNYKLSQVSFGTFNVTPRPLILSVSQQQQFTYGDSPSIFVLDDSEFITRPIGGDDPLEIFTLLAVDESGDFVGHEVDAGTYDLAIQVEDSNYSINPVSGNRGSLTVAPRSLTLLESSASALWNDFEVTVTNLVVDEIDLVYGDNVDELFDFSDLQGVINPSQGTGQHVLNASSFLKTTNYVLEEGSRTVFTILPRSIEVVVSGEFSNGAEGAALSFNNLGLDPRSNAYSSAVNTLSGGLEVFVDRLASGFEPEVTPQISDGSFGSELMNGLPIGTFRGFTLDNVSDAAKVTRAERDATAPPSTTFGTVDGRNRLTVRGSSSVVDNRFVISKVTSRNVPLETSTLEVLELDEDYEEKAGIDTELKGGPIFVSELDIPDPSEPIRLTGWQSQFDSNPAKALSYYIEDTVPMLVDYFKSITAYVGMDFGSGPVKDRTIAGARELRAAIAEFYKLKPYEVDSDVIRKWVEEESTKPENRALLVPFYMAVFNDEVAEPDDAEAFGLKFSLRTVVLQKAQAMRKEVVEGVKAKEREWDLHPEAVSRYHSALEAIDVKEDRAAVAATSILTDPYAPSFSKRETELLQLIRQGPYDSNSESSAEHMKELRDIWSNSEQRKAMPFYGQMYGFITDIDKLNDKKKVARNDIDTAVESGEKVSVSMQETSAEVQASGGSDLLSLFMDTKQKPYHHFLKESGSDMLAGKMSNYDIAAGASGFVAGGVAGSAAGTAATVGLIGFKAVADAIFPTTVGTTTTLLGVSAAPILAVVATAAIVGTVAGVQAAQGEETELIYKSIIAKDVTSVYMEKTALTVEPDVSDPDYDPKPSEVADEMDKGFVRSAFAEIMMGGLL